MKTALNIIDERSQLLIYIQFVPFYSLQIFDSVRSLYVVSKQVSVSNYIDQTIDIMNKEQNIE